MIDPLMKNENDCIHDRLPPSRLYLPKLESPPSTLLAYLITRFPHVSPETWRDRCSRGLITSDRGAAVREDSPYRHGMTVFYRREVAAEPEPMEDADILYHDTEVLVADKPHGMLTRPAGDHMERSLLVRLQRATGSATLAPAHQLDRDTAGVILFTLRKAARGTYQRLFSQGGVEREYLAVAHVGDSPALERWRVENRIEPGEPWYRSRVSEGDTNAITDIELIDQRGSQGLFRIRPHSGKKHQVRVHMAGIGFPIVGDTLYPRPRPTSEGHGPLQLLAVQVSFVDPISGVQHSFRSRRALRW